MGGPGELDSVKIKIKEVESEGSQEWSVVRTGFLVESKNFWKIWVWEKYDLFIIDDIQDFGYRDKFF